MGREYAYLTTVRPCTLIVYGLPYRILKAPRVRQESPNRAILSLACGYMTTVCPYRSSKSFGAGVPVSISTSLARSLMPFTTLERPLLGFFTIWLSSTMRLKPSGTSPSFAAILYDTTRKR